MYTWSKASSFQVFKHSKKYPTDSSALTLHSARNMVVSGQICLRDTDENFEITAVDISNVPSNVAAEYYFTDYIIYNDGVPYPDIISNKKTANVLMNATQSIWIRFRVGKNAPIGTYNINITVHTSLGSFDFEWKLLIYHVSLPEPKASEIGHEYFLCPFKIFPKDKHFDTPPYEPFFDYLRYDENWWDLMANYAKTLAEMRVNSLHLPIMNLLSDSGSKRLNASEWELNFNLFDRMVELFIANGSFKYISVSAIVKGVEGKTILAIDEKGEICELEIYTKEADDWAKTFYSGIYEHFKEKGWLSMLQMRLQDEPHTSDFWKWSKNHCRAIMPDVVCGDPLDTNSVSHELSGYIDQFIPRLEVFEGSHDFYKAQQKAGNQVWCYSCCYPFEMGWMNKFIDLPPIYCRLIKWACFSHGVTGYLHWGFNDWDESLYGLHANARFKGDGFIVYPDVENNSLLLSARGINTIEGLQDWELLKLLFQKNPESAKAISRSIASSFNDIHANSEELEAAHAKILTLLS